MSKKSCKFAADFKNPQNSTEYGVQNTDLICQI